MRGKQFLGKKQKNKQSKRGIGELTMDEKIEEMAKVCCFDDTTCVECFKQYEKFVWKSNIKEEDRGKHCQVYDNAKRLYNAGYRKESDTAREIFEKFLGYIGSQQQFCIVDEEHKTLIDCDKLFDFVGNLAKEEYGVDLGE
jgi:hypothetical protein